MKLESVSQMPIDDSDFLLTTAIIGEVSSSCILARQMIDALGRPGIDSDMEMLGTNPTWTITWTQPSLTLEQATNLMSQAIAP